MADETIAAPVRQTRAEKTQADDTPQAIGKYRIMGLVAKGGMGAVYKAVHPTLKRLVILKKLTIRRNPTVRERFKREAQILLDLHSPYIVHLYDYFIEGNAHYIVEEFVDGMALSDVIEKQVALGTELSLLVFLDACYALKY
ncbi:MAG: protein kinase, partial [Treponemataceae bacterium]|nr:protein kinase [Treponemataceae bacterium]